MAGQWKQIQHKLNTDPVWAAQYRERRRKDQAASYKRKRSSTIVVVKPSVEELRPYHEWNKPVPVVKQAAPVSVRPVIKQPVPAPKRTPTEPWAGLSTEDLIVRGYAKRDGPPPDPDQPLPVAMMLVQYFET